MKRPRSPPAVELRDQNDHSGVCDVWNSCFTCFPITVHTEIFSNFTPKELRTSLFLVNATWYNSLTCPELWARMVEQFGFYSCLRISDPPICERRSKGVVSRAQAIGTGKDVALRSVNFETTNAGRDDGAPPSFLREVSLTMNLTHKHIVQCHGAEVHGNVLHIMTEYLPYNLKTFWQQIKQFPCVVATKPSIIREVVRQLLCGLSHLHHNGIFHRNLKPENVFVELDSRAPQDHEESDNCCFCMLRFTVKIGDLAMGRALNYCAGQYSPENPKDRDRSWREQRRQCYKAPEVLLRHATYGMETDMWSLGCIWTEIAVMQAPFVNDTEMGQLFEILMVTGTPTEDVWPKVCSEPSVWAVSLPQWRPLSWTGMARLLKAGDGVGTKNYEAELRFWEESDQSWGFKLFMQFGAVMGVACLEMLSRLLCIPGDSRLSASQLLDTKLFKDLSTREKAPTHTISPYSRIICATDYVTRHSFDVRWSYFTRTSRDGDDLSQYRTLMIDRLFCIHEEFFLQSQTLHLAVDYFDGFLTLFYHKMATSTKYEADFLRKQPPYSFSDRKIFQLSSLASLKIADVYNEVSKEYYKSEAALDYADISNQPATCGVAQDLFSFSAGEILCHEKFMLNTLKFNLAHPTVLWFVEAYLKISFISRDSKTAALSFFLCDLALYYHEMLDFPIILRAQVIMLLATLTTYQDTAPVPSGKSRTAVIIGTDERKRQVTSGTGSLAESAVCGCAEGRQRTDAARDLAEKTRSQETHIRRTVREALAGFLDKREILCKHNTVTQSARCMRLYENLLSKKKAQMELLDAAPRAVIAAHMAGSRFMESPPPVSSNSLALILPVKERKLLRIVGIPQQNPIHKLDLELSGGTRAVPMAPR